MNDIYKLFKELALSKKTHSALFNTFWILTMATFIPIFNFTELFEPFQHESVPFFQSINDNYLILHSATSIFLLIHFFILFLLLITSKLDNCFNRFLYKLLDLTSGIFSYFVFSFQILKNVGVLNYSTIDFLEFYIFNLNLNNFICIFQLLLNCASYMSLIVICFKKD